MVDKCASSTGHQVQHGRGAAADAGAARQAGPRHQALLQAHCGAPMSPPMFTMHSTVNCTAPSLCHIIHVLTKAVALKATCNSAIRIVTDEKLDLFVGGHLQRWGCLHCGRLLQLPRHALCRRRQLRAADRPTPGVALSGIHNVSIAIARIPCLECRHRHSTGVTQACSDLDATGYNQGCVCAAGQAAGAAQPGTRHVRQRYLRSRPRRVSRAPIQHRRRVCGCGTVGVCSDSAVHSGSIETIASIEQDSQQQHACLTC